MGFWTCKISPDFIIKLIAFPHIIIVTISVLLKSRGSDLFLQNESLQWHPFPKEASLVHIENLFMQISSFLNNGLERLVHVLLSSRFVLRRIVSRGSFSMQGYTLKVKLPLKKLSNQALLALYSVGLVGYAMDDPGPESSGLSSTPSLNLLYSCLALSQMVLVSSTMSFFQRANADSILMIALLWEVTTLVAILLKVTLLSPFYFSLFLM